MRVIVGHHEIGIEMLLLLKLLKVNVRLSRIGLGKETEVIEATTGMNLVLDRSATTNQIIGLVTNEGKMGGVKVALVTTVQEMVMMDLVNMMNKGIDLTTVIAKGLNL